MRKQSGQVAVEFALVVPMFFMMCFGMIYAGILFMDYLNYNNAARAIARVASVDGIDKAKADKDKYIDPITDLYIIQSADDIYIGAPRNSEDVVIPATQNTDVEVVINLTLNADLPRILSEEYGIGFPPSKLKPIKYTMKLENPTSTDAESNNGSDSNGSQGGVEEPEEGEP